MTYDGDLTSHRHLFILDFVSNPEILVAAGKESGITHEYMREISAWCAELNEQLKALAGQTGIELQLMGGNAAALRLDAAAQRGSRDNDYLTTATAREVEELAEALGAKFADLPGDLLKPKRISADGKMPLPLISYEVEVPALTIGNRSSVIAKIEFHLETELPPGEPVTGRPFAVGQQVTTTLPKLPYQIGLKVITLDDPPIGIPPERIDAIPRQIHDIDSLIHLMSDLDDWDRVASYVRRRYEKEADFQNLSPQPEAPWVGIHRRLEEWSRCTAEDALWNLIHQFQSGQVGRATRRSPGEWRARMRRLSVIFKCCRQAGGGALYRRILDAESRIDPKLSGGNLRTVRGRLGATIGENSGITPKTIRGLPARAVFWESLDEGSHPSVRLAELAAALDELGLGSRSADTPS
jgi:hypothetical protein